jgi:hypothetical protein
VLVLVVLGFGYWALNRDVPTTAETPPSIAPLTTPAAAETHPASETHQGFLYGRITTADGATFEGRLRWGGDEEAFWGDYFNGSKAENPWVAHVPPEQLKERHPINILGVEVANLDREIDLGRPFMARFGDISRIEARGDDVRVTLKSGAVFDLDRWAAIDFDDGVRVWDANLDVVDLDSQRIRTIELLPSPELGTAPYRLHATVRTRQGAFTGFVQWDREKCVGTDELVGRTAEGALSLHFDTIRSIARLSQDSSPVTLLDGREIVLHGRDERDGDLGDRNVGMLNFVDDRESPEYVPWADVEQVDPDRPAATYPPPGGH